LNPQVQPRRAIEALRSGVPNRDAVTALGSAQPRLEARFVQQLEAAKIGDLAESQAPSLLIVSVQVG